MILSASRRTDIPAYYSEWFLNRIREGYVCVRNPMNIHQVSRIDIRPEYVDCIVFWTKNTAPMLQRLEELSAYRYYFQYTVTGYGKDVEPNVPDKKAVILPAFQKLSEKIGPRRVIWRYDPILFSSRYTPEYHLRAFRQIAETLRGYTEKCVISFVDIYAKNQKNMAALDRYDMSAESLGEFAGELASIARENGMVTASCAEKIDLQKYGIEHNCCIDKKLIEEIIGMPLNVKKDKVQREECGCVESMEVGSYNTCLHGCVYCYANYSGGSVKNNCRKYDPHSPLLCDSILEGDTVTERKVRSLADGQISLFFPEENGDKKTYG